MKGKVPTLLKLSWLQTNKKQVLLFKPSLPMIDLQPVNGTCSGPPYSILAHFHLIIISLITLLLSPEKRFEIYNYGNLKQSNDRPTNKRTTSTGRDSRDPAALLLPSTSVPSVHQQLTPDGNYGRFVIFSILRWIRVLWDRPENNY